MALGVATCGGRPWPAADHQGETYRPELRISSQRSAQISRTASDCHRTTASAIRPATTRRRNQGQVPLGLSPLRSCSIHAPSSVEAPERLYCCRASEWRLANEARVALDRPRASRAGAAAARCDPASCPPAVPFRARHERSPQSAADTHGPLTCARRWDPTDSGPVHAAPSSLVAVLAGGGSRARPALGAALGLALARAA